MNYAVVREAPVSSPSTNRTIIAGSSLVILLIVAVLTGLLHHLGLNAKCEDIAHMSQAVWSLRALLSAVQDLQTGCESYVATRDKHMLQLCRLAESHASQQLGFLSEYCLKHKVTPINAQRIDQLTKVICANYPGFIDDESREKSQLLRQQFETLRGLIEESERNQSLALVTALKDSERYADEATLLIRLLSAVVLAYALLLIILVWRFRRMLRAADVREREVSRRTIENAPLGIVRLDQTLKIKEANKQFCQYLQVTIEQIAGKPLSVICPILSDLLRPALMHNGLPLEQEKCRLIAPSEPEWQESYWNLLAWPIKNADGKVMEVVAMVAEVSDRVWLMYERDDVYSALAHDLKTPVLAATRVLDMMLSGSMSQDERNFFLLKLKENNEDLLSRIMNLLEVSRYQEAKEALFYESFALHDLVCQCAGELSYNASERKIAVNISVPTDLKAYADRAAVGRLLRNLLDNAIKYTPVEGAVSVACSRQGQQLVIEVSDNGPGIPAEAQSRLFQRFWQGVPGRQCATSTGLGLYLCRKIVESHKGTIECLSAPGSGTTFRVALPLPAFLDVSGEAENYDENPTVQAPFP